MLITPITLNQVEITTEGKVKPLHKDSFILEHFSVDAKRKTNLGEIKKEEFQLTTNIITTTITQKVI